MILSSNILKNIIRESIVSVLNESKHTILYRCYDDDIVSTEWIWLSENFPDDQYGENVAEFSVPLENFNIADYDTTLKYIKTFDITDFSIAMDDEYIGMGMDFFDWNAYENGDISDEQAYNSINRQSWTEVMEHPSEYTFAQHLKQDGYDGYSFQYLDFNNGTTYYAFFNANKLLKYRTK